MLVNFFVIVVETKGNKMKEDVRALIKLICDRILDDESSLTSCQIREMLEDALDIAKE